MFQIDRSTGALTAVPSSPFSVTPGSALGGTGLTVTENPVQTVTGPEAQLFPTAQDTGQVTVGQKSTTQVISLVNTGGQALAVSDISITGQRQQIFRRRIRGQLHFRQTGVAPSVSGSRLRLQASSRPCCKFRTTLREVRKPRRSQELEYKPRGQ
jgi:hypothetical protein